MPSPDDGATNGVLQRHIALYGVLVSALAFVKQGYTWFKNETTYTISVHEYDDVFLDLSEWILELIPPRRRRSLQALTKIKDREGMAVPDDSDSGERQKKQAVVRLLHDGSRRQHVIIDGHKVAVWVDGGERTATSNSGESMSLRPAKVVFEAASPAGRDAVIALIRTVAETRQENSSESRLYMANGWGTFRRRKDLPPRPLHTVITPDGMTDDLVGDLNRFFASEEVYASLGMPWHRGYLFEGPPGSGKTSFARALATHFNMDVWYLPLSDLRDDADLLNCVSSVPARAMLLLEDIDVVHAATDRDDGSPRASMSALLNALDGIATPHGLVTVMTTNHIESIDPAVIRPGRADRIVHIGYIDDEQLERILALTGNIFATDMIPSVDGKGITAAEVIEVIRPHFDSPLRIPDALKAMVYKKEG